MYLQNAFGGRNILIIHKQLSLNSNSKDPEFTMKKHRHEIHYERPHQE